MPLDPAPLLITFHPATLEPGHAEAQVAELIAALDTIGMPMLFTAPNADAEGRVIIARIQDFVRNHLNSRFVTNLGTSAYLSTMRRSAAMVGNSSSGIVEAASFELPVINLGSRQRGRVCGRNVIHAEMKADTIVRAIRSALSAEFRDSLRGIVNPYGDGKAAPRIVEVLKTVPLDRVLLAKSFYSTSDISSTEVALQRS